MSPGIAVIRLSDLQDGKMDAHRYVNQKECILDDTFYVLGDRHPGMSKIQGLRARPTGERRAPKKGEWFLSGQQAFCASAGVTQEYFIAEIVRTALIRTAMEVIDGG